MSESFNLCDIKQLDERTKCIVFGYISRIQRKLSSTRKNKPYYHIPTLVTYICLSYIHDHFMLNRGLYKWVIKPESFNTMLLADNSETFHSDKFKIGKLEWQINAYPNGNSKNSIGSFNVYVKLLALPFIWEHVVISRTIICPQTKAKVTNITTSYEGTSAGWPDRSLLLNEVKYFNDLTFIIQIIILRIKLRSKNAQKNTLFYQIDLNKYNKKQTLKWDIDGDLMGVMKQSHIGKKYESEVFSDLWAIGICPNGPDMDDKGIVFIYLNLCSLPPNISKIKVKWRVRIIETGTTDNNVDDFDYSNYGWEWSTKELTFGQFKKYTKLSIVIDIIVIKEFDIYDDEIMVATKDEIVSEWTKFVQNQNNKHLENQLHHNKAKVALLQRDFIHMNIKMDKMMYTINELTEMLRKQTLACSYSYHDNQMTSTVHKHKHRNNGIMKVKGSNRDKVYVWLRDIVKLEEYYNLFVQNGLDDMEILMDISNQHLIDIGIHKIGHRIKLIKYMSLLKNIK